MDMHFRPASDIKGCSVSGITRDVKLNASPVRIALKSIEIYLLALNTRYAFTILSVKILSVNLSYACFYVLKQVYRYNITKDAVNHVKD